MPRIIAARFQSKDRAEEVAGLLVKHIDGADIFIFHGSPLSQFDVFTLDGDAVGKSCTPRNSFGNITLSVRISDAAKEGRVIATLRTEGAGNIEQPEGEWLDGDWVDFDPVAALRLVKKRSVASGGGGGAGNR